MNTQTKEYFREYHRKRKENMTEEQFREHQRRQRNFFLMRKYGITLDEYNILLKKQNYRCAICDTLEDTMSRSGDELILSTDHNHKTGEVRGLLCKRCNILLGHSRENIEILQKAINYLKREKEQREGDF